MKNEILFHIEKIKTNLLEYEKSEEHFMNPSVLSGATGKLIFFAAYDEYFGKKDFTNFIHTSLLEQIEFINSNRISNHNFNGLVGFAQGVSFLSKRHSLINFEKNNFFSELDSFIIELSNNYIQNKNYDPFYGFIGTGYLLLDRINENSKINKILENQISIMRNHFEEILSNHESEKIEFNISHGLTSVIQFMISYGSTVGFNKELIEFIKRIYQYMLVNQQNCRIPDVIEENNEKSFAPLRWCRGDLSTSYSIGYAAKLLGDTESVKQNRIIVEKLSNMRNCIDQELFSSTICHGTLGVAHLFSKLQLIYNIPEVINAKEYWYSESVNLIKSDVKYDFVDKNSRHATLQGLLNGKEGIGVALLINLGLDSAYLDKFIQL